MEKRDSAFSKFLGVIAGILAIAVMASLAVLFANLKFNFIPWEILLKALSYTVWFGGMALAVCASGWAAFKCGWLIRILFLLVAAAVITFFIMSGVFDLVNNYGIYVLMF